MRTLIISLVVCFLSVANARGEEPKKDKGGHEWPQYKGNSGFTGISPDNSLKPPLKLLWTYRTDGDATGEEGRGIIVADGKVFVAHAMKGSILALDARSGDFVWEAGSGVWSGIAPAYSDGRLFVWAVPRSEMFAFDAATGKILWQHKLAGDVRGFQGHLLGGVSVHGGKVFCSESGDKPAVKALDEKTGKEVWRTPLDSEDGKLVATPCVANGRVFVGIRSGLSGKVHGASVALDETSGKVLWQRPNIFPHTLLVSDGQVVTCAMSWFTDEKLYLLDAKSGEPLWSTPPRMGHYPATLTDKFVLVKKYGPNFTALDRQTGKEAWKFQEAGASGCSTPSVAGNYAYFGTGAPAVGGLGGGDWSFAPQREKGNGYNLYAVDLTTGKAAWKFVMGRNVCADPALAYGRLYATGMDGRVYCFGSAGQGEPTVPEAKDTSPAVPAEQVQALLNERPKQPPAGTVWPMQGGTPQRAGLEGVTLRTPLELAWKLDTGGRVQTSPALSNGKVYVGSDAGKVVAIEAATGKLAWEFQTAGKVRCSPACTGDLVYCGADDGKFHALDTASGRAKWTFAAGGPVRGSPAVAGGVVLFGADDHNIYALDRHTGRKLWNFRSDYYCMTAAPVVHGGHVFVAQWVNWVYALDITTGKVQWRSYVPRSIESLALYQDKLWVRASCGLIELEPQTGKRLRLIESAPSGPNGVGFLKNALFVTGVRGALWCDLGEKGTDPPKIPTLEEVRGLSLRWLADSPTLASAVTPLVLGDKVCFASRDGKIIVTEPSGKPLWSFAMESTCHSSPTAVNGLLVVGCDDGYVYAFRPK